MADYIVRTAFAPKDSLASGDPAKKIKVSEWDAEFSAIATAVAAKIDTTTAAAVYSVPGSAPTFTGPVKGRSGGQGMGRITVSASAVGSLGACDWWIDYTTGKLHVADTAGTGREIRRLFSSDGTQRAAKVIHAHDGTAVREAYRYTEVVGIMTRGSHSGGTTTITQRRGYRASTSTGSWSNTFGAAPTAFFATSSSGANVTTVRTFLYTTGDVPYTVSGSNIRVSADGGSTWTDMEWVTADPQNAPDTIPRYYVDGDPFSIYPASDGTTFSIIVQYTE